MFKKILSIIIVCCLVTSTAYPIGFFSKSKSVPQKSKRELKIYKNLLTVGFVASAVFSAIKFINSPSRKTTSTFFPNGNPRTISNSPNPIKLIWLCGSAIFALVAILCGEYKVE
jgi:hypothetical protein